MAVNTPPRDKIRIKDLVVSCLIGVGEEERTKPQEIVINLTLLADLQLACRSDELADTIDYHILEQKIIDYTRSSSFFLIEKLADQLVQLSFQNPLVQEIRCRIDKPSAPVQARTVSVEIYRRRTDYE